MNFCDEASGCFTGVLFKAVRTELVFLNRFNQLTMTEEQAAQKEEDVAMGIVRGIGSSCAD